MELQLPSSNTRPKAPSEELPPAAPPAIRFETGELAAPAGAPEFAEDALPRHYPGRRIVAMVQDPATLWVSWEGVADEVDAYEVIALGSGGAELARVAAPAGARGAYLRVDARLASRVVLRSHRLQGSDRPEWTAAPVEGLGAASAGGGASPVTEGRAEAGALLGVATVSPSADDVREIGRIEAAFVAGAGPLFSDEGGAERDAPARLPGSHGGAHGGRAVALPGSANHRG